MSVYLDLFPLLHPLPPQTHTHIRTNPRNSGIWKKALEALRDFAGDASMPNASISFEEVVWCGVVASDGGGGGTTNFGVEQLLLGVAREEPL